MGFSTIIDGVVGALTDVGASAGIDAAAGAGLDAAAGAGLDAGLSTAASDLAATGASEAAGALTDSALTSGLTDAASSAGLGGLTGTAADYAGTLGSSLGTNFSTISSLPDVVAQYASPVGADPFSGLYSGLSSAGGGGGLFDSLGNLGNMASNGLKLAVLGNALFGGASQPKMSTSSTVTGTPYQLDPSSSFTDYNSTYKAPTDPWHYGYGPEQNMFGPNAGTSQGQTLDQSQPFTAYPTVKPPTLDVSVPGQDSTPSYLKVGDLAAPQDSSLPSAYKAKGGKIDAHGVHHFDDGGDTGGDSSSSDSSSSDSNGYSGGWGNYGDYGSANVSNYGGAGYNGNDNTASWGGNDNGNGGGGNGYSLGMANDPSTFGMFGSTMGGMGGGMYGDPGQATDAQLASIMAGASSPAWGGADTAGLTFGGDNIPQISSYGFSGMNTSPLAGTQWGGVTGPAVNAGATTSVPDTYNVNNSQLINDLRSWAPNYTSGMTDAAITAGLMSNLPQGMTYQNGQLVNNTGMTPQDAFNGMTTYGFNDIHPISGYLSQATQTAPASTDYGNMTGPTMALPDASQYTQGDQNLTPPTQSMPEVSPYGFSGMNVSMANPTMSEPLGISNGAAAPQNPGYTDLGVTAMRLASDNGSQVATNLARLNSEDPIFGTKLATVINTLQNQGYNPTLDSGARNMQQQAEAYQRKLDGEISAAAPPGLSYHNFGLAGDIGGLNAAGIKALEAAATDNGLYTGNQLGLNNDPGHIQLSPNAGGAPQFAANLGISPYTANDTMNLGSSGTQVAGSTPNAWTTPLAQLGPIKVTPASLANLGAGLAFGPVGSLAVGAINLLNKYSQNDPNSLPNPNPNSNNGGSGSDNYMSRYYNTSQQGNQQGHNDQHGNHGHDQGSTSTTTTTPTTDPYPYTPVPVAQNPYTYGMSGSSYDLSGMPHLYTLPKPTLQPYQGGSSNLTLQPLGGLNMVSNNV